jgi:topoisomerase-4 subunit B
VAIHNFSDIEPTLEFYMGKNTPERKAFIMKNLISEEEELRQLLELQEVPHG